MLFDQDTIKQIQAIAFDAYKTTGRIAALLDGGGDGNRSLAREMSAAAFRLERGTVAFRRLCEQCQTLPPETAKDAPPPAPLDLACWVERSDYGWGPIRLTTPPPPLERLWLSPYPPQYPPAPLPLRRTHLVVGYRGPGAGSL